MSYYIVCQKKRNNPRMDIRVCRKKCDIKDECAGYKSVSDMMSQNDTALQASEIETIQMEAA